MFTVRVVHSLGCVYDQGCTFFLRLVLLLSSRLMAMVLLCNVLGFVGTGQSHGYGTIV